jgi:deoxyribodipyrimidine photo-lyase
VTDPEPTSPRIAVWHRDDLRVRDNAALAAAAADGVPAPVFVVDPTFYRDGGAADARLRFLHESLAALDDRYAARGSGLALRHGDPEDVLDALPVDRLYVNRSVTARYGRERDDALFERDDVTTFDVDGLDRTDRPREAYDWGSAAEAYFEDDPIPAPTTLRPTPLDPGPPVAAVEERYGVDPSKRDVPTGGAAAAWDRLRAFAADLDRYPGGIADPAAAEERTSHLSPYLQFGCLSVREALRHVRREGTDARGRRLFEERCYWNRHYAQKLLDWPGWTERAVNPVFRGLFRDEHDPDLVAAWTAGETGFPLVDAAMRALRETGWLNFRTRALCATFYTYVLRCWWRVGADHFYRHLIDGDAAINYTQWQSQSNLTGVHPVRIYDPRKQVREHDPEGTYVRRYVPELRELPTEHLARPERTPLAVQDEAGVHVGEDYPRPVVDFEARADETRRLFDRLTPRAREALSDPAIRRRASLSQRHGREQSESDPDADARGAGQRRLDDF